MNIGFIGLGKMGLPMAKNLLQAGFNLQVYNRSPERLHAIPPSASVKTAGQAEAAAKDADVVITMVSDDNAVSEILGTILPVMKRGSIHLSMSTIAPATAKHLAQVCKNYQVIYLAAPVLGRPPAAEAKKLFILLSGDAEARQKVQPVLKALGQRVFDYGHDLASANTVKLIMNYMIFVITEMLSEVMLVAEKKGIDKPSLLDTMISTIFGSPVFQTYGGLIVNEKDNPDGFAVKLASKDLRLMQETAALHNMALPLAEVVQQHLKEMITHRGEDKDVSLLISHLRESLKR